VPLLNSLNVDTEESVPIDNSFDRPSSDKFSVTS
jgi:hypothetical protein